MTDVNKAQSPQILNVLLFFRERFGAVLTLHLSPLADLGGETSLDGSDTATRSAVVAGDEVETILTLVELGVG